MENNDFTAKNEQQMINVVFESDKHKTRYMELIDKSKENDSYHRALFYLLALNDVCYTNISSLYNFNKCEIVFTGLCKGFQTGGSIKVTRLAFNLFNGFKYKLNNNDEIATDKNGDYIPSSDFSPEDLFCTGYALYFLEAIKIRFPQYIEREQDI